MFPCASGDHSCKSFTFPVAIVNGTCLFSRGEIVFGFAEASPVRNEANNNTNDIGIENTSISHQFACIWMINSQCPPGGSTEPADHGTGVGLAAAQSPRDDPVLCGCGLLHRALHHMAQQKLKIPYSVGVVYCIVRSIIWLNRN